MDPLPRMNVMLKLDFICVVTYMTEISLIVTLSNQSNNNKWFHLNTLSPAARKTEKWTLQKVLSIVGFEPSLGKESGLQVHRLNHSANSRLLWIKKFNVH